MSTCAACGSPLPVGALFCPGCGSRAGSAIPAAATPTVGGAPRHERRLLTVLFADLVDFTATSDGADPEDVHGLVRPFHALVRREVAHAGGTVARMIGDGVMAVWGYPAAHEDDAARAIRAAIGIRDGVAALGGGRHVRVGVNSGEALVAFSSADEDADDVMGDAVNVAARLASAAPVDGIVAGEATARLVGAALEAEALEPLVLKGKAEPVPAVLVTGLGEAVGRPDLGAFVGRDAELARLLDEVERAAGTGGPVGLLVIGEPGIGKSRLLGELRTRVVRTGIAWHTGRCRPESASPGWALGEIVKAWAGIRDDDAPGVAAARLDAALPTDLRDRDWIRGRLAPLVGLEGPGGGTRDELVAAWVRFAGVLATGPVVIELEDLHWADDDLVAFVADPGLAAIGRPLVLLGTARPEALDRHPGLAGLAQLPLEPLGPDEAAALVDHLAAALDADVRPVLARRGGGNPLFTGELVRLVAQDGPSAVGTSPLPDTVQAVIAARLDLLEPEVRDLVRDAAVVGEHVPRGALDALERLGPARSIPLDAALAELVRLEILRVRRGSSLPGEVELAFRHALVRDVAYGTLTRADRAIRHMAVAGWLAEVAGVERADLAGVIADHDILALELARAADIDPAVFDAESVAGHAFRYLLLAGDHAMELDVRAAGPRFRAAVELAPDAGRRLVAYRRLARALADAGDHRDALAVLDEAARLAGEAADVRTMAAIELERSRSLRPSDPAWAEPIRGAIAMLEPLGPSAGLVAAYAAATNAESIEGSGDRLAVLASLGIAMAADLGIRAPAGMLSRRGTQRASRGDPGGLDDTRAAVHAATEAGDSYDLVEALLDEAAAHAYLGHAAATEAALRRAAEVAGGRGLRASEALAFMNLGYVLRLQGRFAESLAALAVARDAALATQDRMRPLLVDDEVLQTLWMRGDDPAAMREARRRYLETYAVGFERFEFLLARERLLEAADRGDAAGVRAAFEGLFFEAVEDDFDPHYAMGYLPVAMAAVEVGAPDLVGRLVPTIARRSPTGASVHDALAGLLAAAEGRSGEAAPLLAAAAAAWERFGFHGPAARLRWFVL